jgi:hypothetical protein
MKATGWFLKALNWIAWISAVLGLIFIIVGFISAWLGRIIPGTESVNFFHAANSFFLGSIVLFVFLIKNNISKQ